MLFALSHHFPWVGNFTWSIMTFLKAISPEPCRATFGAVGPCTSVTLLWQSARCNCSMWREWINISVLFCVRIPKIEREAQHRVCTCLACWLELNTSFGKQDTRGRKWNKSLAFNCIANGTEWGLSAEFCLDCSESKWFISCKRVVELFWCLRLGRNTKCISSFILTFNRSFAKYLFDACYVLQMKQRIRQTNFLSSWNLYSGRNEQINISQC